MLTRFSGTLVTISDKRQMAIKKSELRADELTFEVHDNTDRLVIFRLNLSAMNMTGEAAVQGQSFEGLAVTAASWRGLGGFVQNARRGDGGASAPTLVYKEEPDYTEEARAGKVPGTVVLSVEIDPTGTATKIKVLRGLGLRLDEKAVQAVKKWKFEPGEKEGKRVTAAATIEVNFRV